MQQQFWTEVITERALAAVQRYNCTDMEVEPLVKEWVGCIREEYRPHLPQVMMNIKRQVWNLTPI